MSRVNWKGAATTFAIIMLSLAIGIAVRVALTYLPPRYYVIVAAIIAAIFAVALNA